MKNQIKHKSHLFFKHTRKFFQILTPEEYLINMKESSFRTDVESCKLIPLPEASKKLK